MSGLTPRRGVVRRRDDAKAAGTGPRCWEARTASVTRRVQKARVGRQGRPCFNYLLDSLVEPLSACFCWLIHCQAFAINMAETSTSSESSECVDRNCLPTRKIRCTVVLKYVTGPRSVSVVLRNTLTLTPLPRKTFSGLLVSVAACESIWSLGVDSFSVVLMGLRGKLMRKSPLAVSVATCPAAVVQPTAVWSGRRTSGDEAETVVVRAVGGAVVALISGPASP